MEEPILKSKPSHFSSHGMASFNTAMVSLAMQNKKKVLGQKDLEYSTVGLSRFQLLDGFRTSRT